MRVTNDKRYVDPQSFIIFNNRISDNIIATEMPAHVKVYFIFFIRKAKARHTIFVRWNHHCFFALAPNPHIHMGVGHGTVASSIDELDRDRLCAKDRARCR